ncbi:hypothetical protein BaRGS_00025352 [Batillaria attramentaria]|uniref:Uncharacterized protein n=1 Tax=Batillaria attramentaria TaxID=370345 RepID=A0ABD0K8K9_9CAEN
MEVVGETEVASAEVEEAAADLAATEEAEVALVVTEVAASEEGVVDPGGVVVIAVVAVTLAGECVPQDRGDRRPKPY